MNTDTSQDVLALAVGWSSVVAGKDSCLLWHLVPGCWAAHVHFSLGRAHCEGRLGETAGRRSCILSDIILVCVPLAELLQGLGCFAFIVILIVY